MNTLYNKKMFCDYLIIIGEKDGCEMFNFLKQRRVRGARAAKSACVLRPESELDQENSALFSPLIPRDGASLRRQSDPGLRKRGARLQGGVLGKPREPEEARREEHRLSPPVPS